eukprot:3130620-Alexandrium_andersonii.AAC.1
MCTVLRSNGLDHHSTPLKSANEGLCGRAWGCDAKGSPRSSSAKDAEQEGSGRAASASSSLLVQLHGFELESIPGTMTNELCATSSQQTSVPQRLLSLIHI